MKKIIIILALIFGLNKLTAGNQPLNFADLIKCATPTTSLFDFQHFIRNPLLPSSLITPELLASTLEKHLPKPTGNSLSYNLGKVALVAASTYGLAWLYRHHFPTSQAVHSPRIGINVPITALHLTIEIQKNEWLAPITINIPTNNDAAGHDAFLQELQRNLTPAEKITTGENGARDVALLQENGTYTFTISGNVTYQGQRRYELQEEQVITTQRNDQNGQAAWIQAFWKKNIAPRIASVWQTLPGDLIDDRITTYHAVITDARTKEQLHSLSVMHKEDFKKQIIEALANEISATTNKRVEINISATTGNNHFALAPINVAIDAPGSGENIHQRLQRSFLHPAFRAAQIEYATQLWDRTCERKLNGIHGIQVTVKDRIKAGATWCGMCLGSSLAIKKLNDADLLGIVAGTVIGFTALTKMHSLYMSHKATYH